MAHTMIRCGLAILCVVVLAACTDRDGPAERLGERVDDTINEARDRVEDAADQARDAFEDALDEADRD